MKLSEKFIFILIILLFKKLTLIQCRVYVRASV